MFGTASLGIAPPLNDPVCAYDTVFRWTNPFMAVSLVLSVIMREKPLSGGDGRGRRGQG